MKALVNPPAIDLSRPLTEPDLLLEELERLDRYLAELDPSRSPEPAPWAAAAKPQAAAATGRPSSVIDKAKDFAKSFRGLLDDISSPDVLPMHAIPDDITKPKKSRKEKKSSK